MLESSRLIPRHRIPRLIRPLIHIKRRHMIATRSARLQPLDDNFIHPHRPHRQNDGQLAAFAARRFNLIGDLIAHAPIHLGHIRHRPRKELLVPPFAGRGQFPGPHFAAAVDLFQIPAARIEILQQRTFDRADQINLLRHLRFLPLPKCGGQCPPYANISFSRSFCG